MDTAVDGEGPGRTAEAGRLGVGFRWPGDGRYRRLPLGRTICGLRAGRQFRGRDVLSAVPHGPGPGVAGPRAFALLQLRVLVPGRRRHPVVLPVRPDGEQ